LISERDSRVGETRAVTRAGRDVRIKARLFVLAAGAIENARLLLTSRADLGGLSPAAASWVGRCFMEHPRDYSLKLVADSPDVFERARFYDFAAATTGVMTCGRLAFENGPLPGALLPNMSVTLLPSPRPPGIVTRALRRAGLAQTRGGYGWSSYADPARDFDGFRLLINLEQRPQPTNRVVLSADRDALGMPRCEAHWSWSNEEQASLVRLRALVAEQAESLGLGRVECTASQLPDPNAHHHAGTTRMAETAEFGVVDGDARVFGLDNLYVTGASVFPTAGFANPMLTIVALADRLGRHLVARG
jgi:choline dehydrogenase-like flavoprotein